MERINAVLSWIIYVMCDVWVHLNHRELLPYRLVPASSLKKPTNLDPFFDVLACADSAKELKEHLETRVI